MSIEITASCDLQHQYNMESVQHLEEHCFLFYVFEKKTVILVSLLFHMNKSVCSEKHALILAVWSGVFVYGGERGTFFSERAVV